MRIRIIAVAAALTLTSSLAVAQTTVPDRPVTVVPNGSGGVTAVDPPGTIQADKTTGQVVRPATPGIAPGARDKSRTGGQGVNDRPAGN